MCANFKLREISLSYNFLLYLEWIHAICLYFGCTTAIAILSFSKWFKFRVIVGRVTSTQFFSDKIFFISEVRKGFPFESSKILHMN